MSLIKWNKKDLFPEFDTMWGDFFKNDFFNQGIQVGTSVPAVNLKEHDKKFSVEVAVPGFNKEDLKVDVENGVLTISSEREEKKEEKDGEKVTRREFNYSSFSRSFSLPENADEKSVKASYEDGMLKIDIDKTKESGKTKNKIEIK